MTSAGPNPNLAYNPAQLGDSGARPDTSRKSEYENSVLPPSEPKLGDNNGPTSSSPDSFSCLKCWISRHPLESVIIAGAIVYFISRKKD